MAESITYMSQDDVRALLRAARRCPRDFAMPLIMYPHGLRASEVALLRRDDADLERGRLRVRRVKDGDGGEHPLAADEVRVLRRYLRARRDADPALFRSRKGGPVTRTQVFRILRGLSAAAGVAVEKAHPHALHHSAGVHRAAAGVDLRLSQDWLEHRNIRNTVIYTRISSKLRDESYFESLASGRIV
jgi:site-specific recombinase XerD